MQCSSKGSRYILFIKSLSPVTLPGVQGWTNGLWFRLNGVVKYLSNLVESSGWESDQDGKR